MEIEKNLKILLENAKIDLINEKNPELEKAIETIEKFIKSSHHVTVEPNKKIITVDGKNFSNIKELKKYLEEK